MSENDNYLDWVGIPPESDPKTKTKANNSFGRWTCEIGQGRKSIQGASVSYCLEQMELIPVGNLQRTNFRDVAMKGIKNYAIG